MSKHHNRKDRDSKIISVPKWLIDPPIDGSGRPPAHSEIARLIIGNESEDRSIEVKLFHSGQSLYIYFTGLPPASKETMILVTSRKHGGDSLMVGDYRFGVRHDGVPMIDEINADNEFVSFSVRKRDFAAVVSSRSDQSWNAELSINLEWLGGYARTDRLMFVVLGANNEILHQWPPSANRQIPNTWGEVVLAPTYSDSIKSGSAFIDGHGSYLVVPYALELNPREITIEAWVRVMNEEYGTLVGNSLSKSYWLAINRVIEFGYGGDWSISKGQTPVTAGWHHIAVTMNEAGDRSFYLDGEVDIHWGWEATLGPSQRKHTEQKPHPVSHNMLRIGSDADISDAKQMLHGYVRDLRIWNCVRSEHQIREGAFVRLTGNENGLVGLWPFTDGLQDMAGGHDAGIMGNSSLAREAPDLRKFSGPTITPSAPDAIPSWDAHIPMSSAQITVDGICRPSEYEHAATLRTEPDKHIAMNLLLTQHAFYLATNILWGKTAPHNSVTVWINSTAQGGETPGLADIRLRLTPDGTLDTQIGDGRNFRTANVGASAATIKLERLNVQEDISIDAPWWSGEICVPLKALALFAPGQSMRFAVQYEGTMPSKILQESSGDTIMVRKWPATFDEERPDTWGLVTTSAIETIHAPIYSGTNHDVAQQMPYPARLADNLKSDEE